MIDHRLLFFVPSLLIDPGLLSSPYGDMNPPYGGGTSGSDQFFFALAASQSFWVSSLNPWPLQEFWPLQELLADLQADCPLQELTPVQCTLASSAEAALKGATLNSTAAAAATAAPDTVLVVALDISITRGG